jgi:hypothetical protein
MGRFFTDTSYPFHKKTGLPVKGNPVFIFMTGGLTHLEEREAAFVLRHLS